MKKFIASILCLLMVLTSMSFAVCAEQTVNENRAINLYVETNSIADATDEMYAGETVTVTIKLESAEELQYASYVLEYNSKYFKCTDKNFTITGVAGGHREDVVDETTKKISHYTWSSEYAYAVNEQVLAVYIFEAIAQPTEVTDYFTISEAYATHYLESADDEVVPVQKNNKDVTILLIDHSVKKYVDGTLVDETAGEVNSDSFPYDDNDHKFRIETVPTATIEYTVKLNGEEITPTIDNDGNIVIKDEGTYVIEYEATDETVGYAPVEGTFTITIEKPVYVVEVGTEAYVDNKDIVIVYTNTPNIGFSYKNKDWEMVDVSGNGYLYDDPRTTAVEAVPYTYKFAYVVDVETAAAGEDIIGKYEANVIHWYKGNTDSEGYELVNKSVGDYKTDVTDNGNLTVDDIVFAYGVTRVYDPYFETEKYQYRILRLDLDNNKIVRNEDVTDVVNDVKSALGIE